MSTRRSHSPSANCATSSPEQFRDEIVPALQPVRAARRRAPTGPRCAPGANRPQAMANYLRGFDNGASSRHHVRRPRHRRALLLQRRSDRPQLRAPAAAHRRHRSTRLLALLDAPTREALYVGAVPTPGQHAGLHARQRPAAGRSRGRAARVDRQPRHGADALRHLAQHRLRRRRAAALHAVSARAAGQSLRRAARVHARRSADQHGETRRSRTSSGSRVSATRSPPRRWPSSNPATRCSCPYMWWHHVESREPFNVLVNYWWDETPPWQGSPFEALLHGIMSVKSLPPRKRAIWRNGVPALRLPGQRRPGGAPHAAPARHPGRRRSTARRDHPPAADPRDVTGPALTQRELPSAMRCR